MRIVTYLLLAACFISCGEEVVENPKPRAYPKVDYPERSLDTLDNQDCPFSFLYMNYGQVEKKTEYFDTDPIHPCWFDIALPDFDGRIHFSYVSIENSSHFDKLVADAFKLSGKHNVKANYIDEIPFKNKQGVSGMVFNLEGPVASPFQFFMTDTTEHFLRGSLYLNTEIRPDSLAPIYEFLKKDITLILNTLEWEDN